VEWIEDDVARESAVSGAAGPVRAAPREGTAAWEAVYGEKAAPNAWKAAPWNSAVVDNVASDDAELEGTPSEAALEEELPITLGWVHSPFDKAARRAKRAWQRGIEERTDALKDAKAFGNAEAVEDAQRALDELKQERSRAYNNENRERPGESCRIKCASW
jgi:hypothetical protein